MSSTLTRLIPGLLATALLALGQDPKAAIQQKLESEYAVTQTTAAEDDIVTAGSILVLKKSNLMMTPTTSTNMYQNTYKDGKITQNSLGKADGWLRKARRLPGMSSMSSATSTDVRTYVTGEKMWLTKIDVKDDGVVLSLFTDAINDVRYKADLKFPWPKGTTLPVDQVDKTVAEVFSVQPADDSKAQDQQQSSKDAKAQPAAGSAAAAVQAPAAPAKPAEAPPPPIAPPPPPTDAPTQTIAVGQTTDQVVATVGQPQRIIKLSSKEIYVYKDMKITFVGGKVKDVQ